MTWYDNDPMTVADLNNHLLAILAYRRCTRDQVADAGGRAQVGQSVFEDLRYGPTQLILRLRLVLTSSTERLGVEGKLQLGSPFGRSSSDSSSEPEVEQQAHDVGPR